MQLGFHYHSRWKQFQLTIPLILDSAQISAYTMNFYEILYNIWSIQKRYTYLFCLFIEVDGHFQSQFCHCATPSLPSSLLPVSPIIWSTDNLELCCFFRMFLLLMSFGAISPPSPPLSEHETTVLKTFSFQK